jgi:hypothetical protein
MTPFTRRNFLKQGALGVLTFSVGGCDVELTPREAHDRGVAMRVLSGSDTRILETLGEVLLPGSGAAGLAHYIDHQLAEPADKQLLMIKYLNVNPPFADFYRGGLASLNDVALAVHQSEFSELDAVRQGELVSQIAREDPPGWRDGPPAPFFYFVVRNDALDVTYGTMQGFEALGIPYMAHIEPPSRWGE